MDLAPGIGAAPGAVVVRSDEIRKHLCGVKPLDRLGPEGYTDDMNRRVYSALIKRSETLVRGGAAVIADAVFARPADRDAIHHVAAAAGVPFVGVWLEAPESVLLARIAGRGRGVSDADIDVLHRQLAQSAAPVEWHHIDSSGTRQQVGAAAGPMAGGVPLNLIE
jgi:predicted kinase